MQRFTHWCIGILALGVVASSACSAKTEPSAGQAGSNTSGAAKAAVDCVTARSNAATTWESWATSVEAEKTDTANSHMNLQMMSEAAAQAGADLNADDPSKTRAVSAKATLTILAALDQAYAPAAAAAREAALELRTPQGASKHLAALQQAKTLVDAEQAFDQQSLDVAAATATSIEIMDLPAAALDHPEVKAKLDAMKAKRAEAIASVEALRKSRLEKTASERKTVADLENSFAPCAK